LPRETIESSHRDRADRSLPNVTRRDAAVKSLGIDEGKDYFHSR
jgi:hypothetical protein